MLSPDTDPLILAAVVLGIQMAVITVALLGDYLVKRRDASLPDTQWQKCKPPIWPFKRGEDGLFFIQHNGQVLRRRVNGRWHYRQDEETIDERLNGFL